MELFFFLLVTLGISVAGGILYIIYVPIKSWLVSSGRISPEQSKRINKIYIYLLITTIMVITYIGIFPDESFYAEEFKDVTLKELPHSAKFISKSASYPDFHGDYCSQSQIRLSKNDYSKLLWELHEDERLSKGDYSLSDYNNKVPENLVYQFTRVIDTKDDELLYIGFGNDSQTVYVNVYKH
jgi:hypothetical protein